jgi:hypothetical protein
MMTLGMVVTFAAYTITSWGYILVKGWDIPLRSWVSPLHPYTWPAGGAAPTLLLDSELFPTGASAPSGEGSAGPLAPAAGTGSGSGTTAR